MHMTTSVIRKQDEAYWTAAEVCEFLRIGRTTLWSLTKLGTIPCVRVGRSLRFRPEEIRAVGELRRVA